LCIWTSVSEISEAGGAAVLEMEGADVEYDAGGDDADPADVIPVAMWPCD
jgi:hypothetical protein